MNPISAKKAADRFIFGMTAAAVRNTVNPIGRIDVDSDYFERLPAESSGGSVQVVM